VEESERDKLVKVLRMFGSNHDGEVAAAARLAHGMVKKHHLDWGDLLMPVGPGNTRQHQEETHHNTANDENNEAFLIRRASKFLVHLTDWEREFLQSIADSLIEWGRLTPKQRGVLDRINNKLKLRGCW
jgi:hypothetical protein